MVTRTWVSVPRHPPRLVRRDRLLNRLTDFLDYRLILVTAPAGYGKTSLLIDFVHHASLPECWYTADEVDQDPRLFIAHFLAAIAHRFPQFNQTSEAVLLTSSASLNIERLVQMIVNEAYHQIQNRYLIILDDYHLTGDNETINRFVSCFVQQADENCYLCLASRAAPALPDLPLILPSPVTMVWRPALYNLAARHEHVHRVGQCGTMSIPPPRRSHSRSRHKLLAFLDSVPETQLLDLKNRAGI